MNWLFRVLGWAFGLAVISILVVVGTNIYNVVATGRWASPAEARAQLAQAGALDLARSSVSSITAALGNPEYKHRSRTFVNADDYRWARGAVEVEAIQDDVVHADIGQATLMALLPLDRAKFPGSIMGLKLGDPTPDAAHAAELDKALKDCCGGFMGWRGAGGHVVGIYYRANTSSVPVR